MEMYLFVVKCRLFQAQMTMTLTLTHDLDL